MPKLNWDEFVGKTLSINLTDGGRTYGKLIEVGDDFLKLGTSGKFTHGVVNLSSISSVLVYTK